MNKSNNKNILNNFIKAIFILFVGNFSYAQEDKIPFDQGKKYVLADVDVTGKITFNKQTVITFAGLEKGQNIVVPGEDLRNAIKKLGNLGLFSDIDFYATKIVGDSIYLQLDINELPKLNDVKLIGVKKSKVEDLIKENSLTKGKIVNENLLTTTKNYLENKYKKEGYFKTKVTINTVTDTITPNLVNMVVYIDKGEKVKISQITFEGNEVYEDKKLRSFMKNTKQINRIRILKASKYVKDKYKEDLVTIVDKYKERGYRDARVVGDSVY